MAHMKYLLLTLSLLLPLPKLYADVAPIKREAHGLCTIRQDCKVRMESEIVSVDLYNDSSVVTCTFDMVNYGDADTFDVGFPEMNFLMGDGAKKISLKPEHYELSWNEWKAEHAGLLKMSVNGTVLPIEALQFTTWSDSQKNTPWFVWKESFQKGERKQIQVSYAMAYGTKYHGDKHVGANVSRTFCYILETGAGWYGNIGSADIIVRVHDISLKHIEEVAPQGGGAFSDSSNTFCWHFNEFEPTAADNIVITYYDADERRETDEYFKEPASPEATYGDGAWYNRHAGMRNRGGDVVATYRNRGF